MEKYYCHSDDGDDGDDDDDDDDDDDGSRWRLIFGICLMGCPAPPPAATATGTAAQSNRGKHRQNTMRGLLFSLIWSFRRFNSFQRDFSRNLFSQSVLVDLFLKCSNCLRFVV